MPPKAKSTRSVGINNFLANQVTGTGVIASIQSGGGSKPKGTTTVSGTTPVIVTAGASVLKGGTVLTGRTNLQGTGVLSPGTLLNNNFKYYVLPESSYFSAAKLANIRNFFVVLQPQPRSELTVPVSPDAKPHEDTVFEEPKNARKKLFLPKHELATRQTSSGQPEYDIELHKRGTEDYALVLDLKEISSQKKTVPFSSRKLVLSTRETGVEEKRYFVTQTIDNQEKWVHVIHGFAQGETLINALRNFELFKTCLYFEYELQAAVADKKNTEGVQLYRTKPFTIPVKITRPFPFEFPPDRHARLYAQTGMGGTVSPELVRIVYDGKPYYQYSGNPNAIKYFPDAFKLIRNTEAPFAPGLKLKLSAPGESENPSDMNAVLEYQVAPIVDEDRLSKAREAFEREKTLPFNVQWDRFYWEPFNAPEGNIDYELALPRSATTDPLRKQITGVITDLEHNFVDELILPLAEFQGIYDALFGGSKLLFTGKVTVKVQDQGEEVIDFEARLNNLHGEYYSYVENYNAGDKKIDITVTNAIESPIEVQDILQAQIAAGEDILEGTVTSAPAFPFRLEPGASFDFSVVLADGAATIGDTPVAMYDIIETVLPDKEKVFDLILDRSVQPDIKRSVDVETTARLFEQNQDIFKLSVFFPSGQFVELSPDSLTGSVTIPLPVDRLKDVVLKKSLDFPYEYTIRVIPHSGDQYEIVKSDDKAKIYVTSVVRPPVPAN